MDTKKNERADWEKKAARACGIDRKRERAFMDKVRRDTGGVEGFADYEEFEAFVESAWSYITLDREQRAESASYDLSGGRSEYAETQSSKPSVEPSVELNERTGLRIAAFSEYLAKIAACDKRVMRLRERICGGVTKTLPPEKALEFMEAHSMKGVKEIVGHEDSLPWPDGSDHGRHFRVQEGSVLEDLRDATTYFNKHYPWSVDQAANFILCGVIPKAGVVTGGHKVFFYEGVAAHIFNRTTVKLEVDSWVSADEVRKAYLQLQHRVHNNNNSGIAPSSQSPRRHPSPRNLAVFRFVVSQSSIQVVDAKHRLSRLKLPRWRDMLEDWNAPRSPEDPWYYSDVRNFKRDFDRAQLAVIDTDQGLPGIPGQPMTIEEQKEMHRRLKQAYAQSRGAR